MFIRDYKRDKIFRVEASCDQCGHVQEYTKTNYKQAITIHLGKSFCRRCVRTCQSKGKVNYKGTPIHNSYSGAKQRCEYKAHSSYSRYGGRGIEFLWDSFEEFRKDMEHSWFEGGTIERIDLDGNYCKENCTWVTNKEQLRNTSRNIHTLTQAELIRHMYESGATQVELANKFNDSQGNISNIIRGRTWS